MSKKILSVALALIFVISTFAVSALAVGGTGFEEEGAGYTQAWKLEKVGEKDGTYSVGVYLKTNYLVGPVQFKIENADGNAVLGGVTSDVFVDGEFDIQYTDSGLVFVVPTPVDYNATAIDTTTETLIATLSYTLKADATSATLAIEDDAKTEANPGGSLIAARMSDDNLVTGTMIYGQDVTVGESITIGSAAADLALTSAGSTAGVLIDTHKTFGNKYAGVVYGFTQVANNTFMTTAYLTTNLQATNGGTLEFGRSIGKVGYGTGTTITVKNSDSSVSKVYVVVIFGDVDGNGQIATADATAAKAAITNKTLYPDNSVQRMAANAQTATAGPLNNVVATAEATAIKNNATTKLNQVTLANNQYKFNTNYQ